LYGQIQILRQGAVVKSQVERVLQECKIQYDVEVVVRAVKMSGIPLNACSHRHVDDLADGIETEGQQVGVSVIVASTPSIRTTHYHAVTMILLLCDNRLQARQ
jgi:hypothetical protein